MRALLSLLALAVLCATLGVTPAPAHAQGAAPAFEAQGTISGATEVKFPHVAAFGPNVHVAANINREAATYWTKQDTAPTFGAGQSLGVAEGQPDYSTTTITTGKDGTLYYAWVNQPTRTISLRVKRPGQDWTPPQLVVSGQPFPVFPEIAVTSDGQLFVVWRNPDRPFMYRRSVDGGATWGPIQALSDGTAVNIADLAVGPQGQLAVAYMGGERDRLQIYVATWNGSGFTKARVTPLNGDYADPSVTFAPDGRLFVAWRGVAERGSTSGVFFAERQADGSYPVARLVSGQVQGRVSLEADDAGNLHAIWNAGGKVWYSVKPANGPWAGPVDAPAAGGTVFNVHAAVSVGTGGAIYAHAVSEVFVGSRISLRTYRFRSGLAGAPMVSARPVIAQGAARTRAASLAVGFADLVGTPSEVRARWGAPPTDADPWQPYATEIAVAAPAPAASCVEHTLYTQVRSAAVVQAQALTDTITLDTAVQAAVRAYREDAAPGYTNRPVMDVLVEDAGECSGFASIRPLLGDVAATPFTTAPYLFGIDLEDAEGTHERAVELADALGNTSTVTVSVVYDRTAPTATYAEALAITPDPQATIFQSVQLRGATYADGPGGDDVPWAVAVAVSRSPISLASSDLRWTVIPLAPGAVERSLASDGPATISAEVEINLAELVARPLLGPGAYYYAAAFVDKAGNRSAAVATGALELEAVTYFRSLLPMLRTGGK